MKKIVFITILIVIVGLLYFKFPVFYCKLEYSNSYSNNVPYDNSIIYLNYYDSGVLSLQVPEGQNLLLIEIIIYDGEEIVWNKKYNKEVTKVNFVKENYNLFPNYVIEKKLKMKKVNKLKIVLEYKENDKEKKLMNIYSLKKTRPYCNFNSGQ